LDIVQQRIRCGAGQSFSGRDEAQKEFPVAEGTDARYGARPLKRDQRLLVPLSNLMASRQIRRGDIRVSHSRSPSLAVLA
jgi:hypothetical protein